MYPLVRLFYSQLKKSKIITTKQRWFLLLCPPGRHLPTKLQTWGTALNPINLLITTGEIKKRQPCHNIPKTCGGSNSICLVWIRPTYNLLTRPRASFRINERWSNKYNTHKTTINKINIGKRTWRIFLINQSYQFMQTSMNTQPSPSPQPSTNMQVTQIRMSGLYMANRKRFNAPEDKFQDQWTLIRLMRTDRSTINDENMITKTLNNNTRWMINQRDYYNM